MGKQLVFFLTDEDWEFVKINIIKKGFIFLQHESEQAFPLVLDYQNIHNLGYQTFALVLANQVSQVEMTRLNNGSHFCNSSNSPIIELSTGIWNNDHKNSFRGRLLYYPEGFDSAQNFVPKNEIFLKSAQNLFRWFKRNFKQMEIAKNFYIGKELAQMVENQGATISF